MYAVYKKLAGQDQVLEWWVCSSQIEGEHGERHSPSVFGRGMPFP